MYEIKCPKCGEVSRSRRRRIFVCMIPELYERVNSICG